jgi:adenylate cyclase
MGDPVNLASRLEGLNKYYDTSILISSATYEGWQKTIQETKLMFESPFDFEDIDPSNIPCRRMEKAKVKGKNVSNLVYEILPFEQYDDRKDDFALYEQGYDLFLAGRFQDALGIFTIVKQNQKEGLVDNVVQKKIEMCEAFAKEPPAEWDGSLRMEEK